MPFPPRDHRISLTDAAALTRRFRDQAPADGVRAGAFHADQVRALLDQPGCVAFRIYLGRQADGTETFVLVGVDANDKDMTGGVLLDVIYPCPPFCEDGSALNS